MKKDTCPYCKKPLEKIECSKYENSEEYDFSIHEGITFILFIISLFLPKYKKKLDNHKYKITCINEDCLGYLEGCYVNKDKKMLWSYEFPKK